MARQSGYRLAEERRRHGLSQAQLAEARGVTPRRVSQIERGEVATIAAIVRYIEALGGRRGLIASFGDHTLTVATTEAASWLTAVPKACHSRLEPLSSPRPGGPRTVEVVKTEEKGSDVNLATYLLIDASGTTAMSLS